MSERDDDDKQRKRRAERSSSPRRSYEREALRAHGKQSLIEPASSSSTPHPSSSPGKRTLVEGHATPAQTEVEQHAHLLTTARGEITGIQSSALPAFLKAMQRKGRGAIAHESAVMRAGHRVQHMMLVAEQRVQALCDAGLSGDPAVSLLRSDLAALREHATLLGAYRGAEELLHANDARSQESSPKRKSALDTHGLGALGRTEPAAADATRRAPATPASLHEQLVEMKATAHAAALMLARPTTKDRGDRWQFLNTLDRIDDPALRAKTLEKFQAQTGMPLRTFIRSTAWHSDRDEEQALELISPRRDTAERDLQAMDAAARKKLAADAARLRSRTRISRARTRASRLPPRPRSGSSRFELSTSTRSVSAPPP